MDPQFSAKINASGVMMVSCSCTFIVTRPPTASPWLRKYIFPGAYSPALSEVFTAVEQASLWVADVEFLRLHYARTLQHWHRTLRARTAAEIAALYDERF